MSLCRRMPHPCHEYVKWPQQGSPEMCHLNGGSSLAIREERGIWQMSCGAQMLKVLAYDDCRDPISIERATLHPCCWKMLPGSSCTTACPGIFKLLLNKGCNAGRLVLHSHGMIPGIDRSTQMARAQRSTRSASWFLTSILESKVKATADRDLSQLAHMWANCLEAASKTTQKITASVKFGWDHGTSMAQDVGHCSATDPMGCLDLLLLMRLGTSQ